MADNAGKGFDKKVDEDWKKRAKDEADAVGSAAPPQGSAQPETGPADETDEKETEAARKMLESLPPFIRLVSDLAVQASIHMGFTEDPVSGKKTKNLEAAKYLLDTLGMLEEKTKGNLDEAEASYLEEVLYNLRMGYVHQAK